MEQWSYSERKQSKVFFWSVFVFGELFLFAIFIFALSQGKIQSLAVATSLFAWLLWSGLFLYFFSNFPHKITVSSEGLLAIYSDKRTQLYSWENVLLKKIGLNPIPLILIKNKGSSLLPRIVFLDGSSKEYRELIKRISAQGV